MTKAYTYRDSHKAATKGTNYDKYYASDSWEKFLWLREQQILLKILNKYYQNTEIHLLDFACGTGRITHFLEDHVTTSVGIDVSKPMLEKARQKLKQTEIIQADITQENVLAERKFNLITAFRFFLNAEPSLRTAVIAKLTPRLAENGYLIFNNHHNLGSPWIKLGNLRHLQKCPDGIYNVMTIFEMQELVEKVGLKIIEIYPAGFFHPPKIPVPQVLTNVIEDICCRIKSMSRFSENVVVVCGHRKKKM